MTNFGHQLRLLLWKNYLIRKRHKVRLIIELACPLILFLIFMWVRTKGLKFNKPHCHLVEKALPSVGGFEFIQNFVCTLNNTCHDDFVEDKGPKEWEDALIVKFVRDSGPLLKELVSTEESIKTVRTLWLTIANFVKREAGNATGPTIPGRENITLGELLTETGKESFFSTAIPYLGLNKTEASELLESTIILKDLNNKVVDDLINDLTNGSACNKTYSFVQLPSEELFERVCNLPIWKAGFLVSMFRDFLQKNDLANLIQNGLESQKAEDEIPAITTAIESLDRNTIVTLVSLASITSEFFKEAGDFIPANGTGVSGVTSFLYKGLCGLSVDPNATSFGFDNTETSNRLDSIRDRLRDWRTNVPYRYDPEVDETCNKIFEQFHSRPFTNLLWRQVKPYIRGQVLFAPATNFTTELMEKVDARFSELKQLEENINVLLTAIHRGRSWFSRNSRLLIEMQKMVQERTSSGNSTLQLNQMSLLLRAFGLGALVSQVDPSTLNKLVARIKDLDLKAIDTLLSRIDIGGETNSHVLGCVRYNKSVPFETECEAVEAGMHLLHEDKLWAVVVFEDVPANGSAPHHMKYKIRMDSDKVDQTRLVRDRLTSKSPRRRPTLDLKYITHGFIYLQEMIEHSFIEMTTGTNMTNEVSTVIQQFPFPCYIFDQFIRAISRTFPLFMVLSWVYASAMIVKSIVLEKELRLKEVMKVMGLSNSVIWTGWFIDSAVVMSVSTVVLTVILKYGKIVEFSDFSLLLVFMLSFTLATICFSFMLSTLFSRANSAAAAGGILFFVSYLPYNFMLLWEERLTWHHLLFSCLISNVAFGFGCTYLARYEEDGLGAQWDRISLQTLPDDNFNLSYCILMLLFDSALYLFLTWYIENVFPGDAGMPRRWYFLFQKSYWCPITSVDRRRKSYSSYGGADLLVQESTLSSIEAEPTDLVLGVQIANLSKTYDNGRIALADLSMNFYEGQITSFLGHNGAGKTTTISILTGLFPPSKGTARVYGNDIRTDMTEIRKDLGICPQHNVLFDRLTVEEHLKFYAGLKGQEKTCEKEMDKMLEDLGFPHRRYDYPRSLSGGMKRKLSVACAFVGGSKTVFLDEPTSGVDPFSRRSIWELLLKYKTGRTIILTTHFMDEADLLGDRIAIISQGRMVASGSSLFLKSHYGRGYSLRLVREEMSAPEEELLLMNNVEPSKQSDNESKSMAKSLALGRQTDLCTNFVHFRVPDAILMDDAGSEIIYLLPYPSMDSFPSLFNDLDENLGNLRISSYGISDTTLEDVFLKITADDLEMKGWANKSTFCQTCCCNRKLMTNLWKMRKSLRKKKRKVCQEEVEPPPVIVHSLDAGYITPADHIIPSVDEQLMASNDKTLSTTPPQLSLEQADPELSNSSDMSESTMTPPLAEPTAERQEFLTPNLDERHGLVINFRSAPPKRSTSNILFLQMRVILKKRLRNSFRNLRALFFEIILPVVFIALALALTLILPPLQNEQPRLVTPKAYPSPNYIFFSEPQSPDQKSEVFDKFVDELVGPLGVGTTCMSDSKSGYCKSSEWSEANKNNFYVERDQFNGSELGTCDCSVGSFQCNQKTERRPPPIYKTSSNDMILDVSKMENVPLWVRQTYKEYEFKRLGGYEMALRRPPVTSFTEYIFLLDCVTSLTPHNGIADELTPKNPKPFFKVWFENRAWLTSIAYLNSLSNALLRDNLESTNDESEYGITLYTHPMNLTKLQQEKESIKTAALGVVHAICVIFALGFVPASFTMYLIEERHSGAKHLHLVAGVKPLVYWISSFIFDMSKYLVSVFLCLLLFFIFNAEAYITKASIGAFISLLMLYGWASIPLMYPASYIFSVPSTAFVVLGCTNLFIGVISTVSVFVLEQLGDKELESIGLILQQVYLVFPQYCLGRGLMTLVRLHIEDAAFSRLALDDATRDRFEWDLLGMPLAVLAVHGFLFFILNLSYEYKQWFFLLCKRKFPSKWNPQNSDANEDPDVRKEADRVFHNPSETSTLVAQNLTKIYHGRSYPAVNKLTFAVERGECFGLLGVNGAGKTSTFKMLTGDVRISYGQAKIMTYDVEKDLDSARKHFGYCPQEDGLDPLLNTYETLELYGRLRGMSMFDVKQMSEKLVEALGLQRYATKRCGTYSGGNKRKVSTAIALIGNPDLVFLDEPTSGMDPGARRQLWKVILKIIHHGKSVVLTTHSMEECEALCHRLAIMVNGKFTCFGSLQHLKNRFGNGYMLTVRCGENIREELLNNLSSDLPSAVLEDTHCSQLKFKILQHDVKLGDIFSVMYKEKMAGLIEDYSVSQTTLDDIFVKFASQQRDEMDGKPYGGEPNTSTSNTSGNNGPITPIYVPADYEAA